MEGMVARGTRSRAARIAPATQTPRCRSYALHRTDPPAAPTIVDRSVFNGSFCFAFLGVLLTHQTETQRNKRRVPIQSSHHTSTHTRVAYHIATIEGAARQTYNATGCIAP